MNENNIPPDKCDWWTGTRVIHLTDGREFHTYYGHRLIIANIFRGLRMIGSGLKTMIGLE